jgi:hypothetical protein
MADESVTLESIAWRGVHVELPGADQVVLVYGPELDLVEVSRENGEVNLGRVWLGYHNVELGWVSVDGCDLPAVTHWAEMPTGANP